jgi:CBS domain-containing protein
MHPASLVTVGPDDDVRTALQRMASSQVRRLPVVDEHGALVGIMTLSDPILHALARRRRRTPDRESSARSSDLRAAPAERKGAGKRLKDQDTRRQGHEETRFFLVASVTS